MGQYKNQELDKEFVIPRVEIPPDGWFHGWAMDKIFTKELSETMRYPLKKSMFAKNKNYEI